MLDIGQQELQMTLQQLDQALYSHEQWLKEVIRTIICRLPYDLRDVAEDSHRQCRFGQWYYGNPPLALREHPAFVAIETEHARMHQLGAKLLLAATNETTGSPIDYDHFINTEERLHLEICSLKHELDALLLNRDALTGADNRFSMLAKLRELRELVKRRVQQCSLAIMDLDHFKTINDTYGHSIGDQMLVALVHYIKTHLRPYDQIYRYGGEEFLLALPSTELQAARTLVERIRKGIATDILCHDGDKPIATTVSFGIALLDPDISVEESINRADTALYAAKNSGRNCVYLWEPTMTPKQDGENSLRNAIAAGVEGKS